MRCIFVGVEYAGKSTLINLLSQYYQRRKLGLHGDDHFSMPDSSLSPESQAVLVGLPDDIKERTQRMQIHYHIDVLKHWPHVGIGGWHIEEAVYTSMYGEDPESPYYKNYYRGGHRNLEALVLEAHLPDLILVHVTASDEAIRARMKADPHKYQIIKEEDISEVKRRMDEEVEKSLFSTGVGCHKIDLDTTDKTPQESFDELLLLTDRWVMPGELALRAMPLPEGEYEVRYENGVRKMVPVKS